MLLYRMYWMGADGHYTGAEDIECASDQEAITKAWKQIGDAPAMEVWLGTRRVAQLGSLAQDTSSSSTSDSRGVLLLRAASTAVLEHRRLLAEQREAREAIRRTRAQREQQCARAAGSKSDTPVNSEN